MKCPKCGSKNTKKISVVSEEWFVGGEKCKDCGHKDHWTKFIKKELSPDNFGPHFYPGIATDSTSDCKYGCGCWMGSFRSDGPEGIDPFGLCPKNPINEIVEETTACEGCGFPTGSEECRVAHEMEIFPGNLLGPHDDICPGCQHSITSQEHVNAHKSQSSTKNKICPLCLNEANEEIIKKFVETFSPEEQEIIFRYSEWRKNSEK
jgi:hypothetical protein